MKQITLRRQLAAQAGSSAETRQLTLLASHISNAVIPHLEHDTKTRIARDIGFAYHPWRQAMARTAQGFAVVLLAVMLALAQTAKPGSALFGVKKETDKARAAITQNLPFVSHPEAIQPAEHSVNFPPESTREDQGVRRASGSTSGSSEPPEIINAAEGSRHAVAGSSQASDSSSNSGPRSVSDGFGDGSSDGSNRGPGGGSNHLEGY